MWKNEVTWVKNRGEYGWIWTFKDEVRLAKKKRRKKINDSLNKEK
jgi:hypothetical protein